MKLMSVSLCTHPNTHTHTHRDLSVRYEAKGLPTSTVWDERERARQSRQQDVAVKTEVRELRRRTAAQDTLLRALETQLQQAR